MAKADKIKLITDSTQDVADDLDDLGSRLRKSRAELIRTAISEFLERSRTLNGDYATSQAAKVSNKRPTEYSTVLGQEIFERLTTPVIDGNTNKAMYPSLTSVCASPEMPALPLAVKWKDEIPEFALLLEKSLDIIAYSLMDKLVETLQVVDAQNSRETSPAVQTLLTTLKQVAPKIFSPSSALTQLVEDKVILQLNLIEVTN